MAEEMMNEQTAGQEGSMPPQQEAGGEEMTQKQQAYISGMMKMLHSKETSGRVVAMLKSAPPERSIPDTALTVNKQFEDTLKEKGQKPDLDTSMLGGIYLVSDLVEIGNAAQLWDIPQEETGQLLEITMEEYIKAGLKDGSIDPVELQEKVEPLMNEQQRAMGSQGAQATGVPEKPGQMAAMESYAMGRERKAVSNISNKQAANNRQGMMQQAEQAPPQQAPQGGQ